MRGKSRPDTGKVFESFCEKHIRFFKVYSYVEGKKYRGMVQWGKNKHSGIKWRDADYCVEFYGTGGELKHQ